MRIQIARRRRMVEPRLPVAMRKQGDLAVVGGRNVGPGGAVSMVKASPTPGIVADQAGIPIGSSSAAVNSQRSLRFCLGSAGAVNS